MKKQTVCFVALILSLASISISAQIKDTLAAQYYHDGVIAERQNDFDAAKSYFKKSLDEEKNSPAAYELAKIYKADSTNNSWNISRRYIKEAIKLDPNNPEYHLFYGLLAEDLYNNYVLEFQTIEDARSELKKTIELDSTNVIAARHLGKIDGKLFLEYHNSVSPDAGSRMSYQTYITLGRALAKQIYDNFNMSNPEDYNVFANEVFKDAEESYIIQTRYDSLNSEPYLKLATIYEDNNEPGKGIKYLKKLERIKPENKEVHLELGLLYYEQQQYDSAYAEYKTALDLMDKQERDDFTYNSVMVLLKPYLKDKIASMNEATLKRIIDMFWRVRDPLNLTPYNERLLEHYSRVAYANLRFGVPKLGLPGWKTDRGTVMIRYGKPVHVYRIRNRGYDDTTPETEIWNYADNTFSFVRPVRNGEYIYGIPGQSQYWDDTQRLVHDLEFTRPEEYHPKFEGPIFYVPNKVYQFKCMRDGSLTDIYLSYAVKSDKNVEGNVPLEYKHKVGVFLFDQYFRKLAESKNEVKAFSSSNKIVVPDSGNLYVNTEKLEAIPDSGNLAFEVIRNTDKGVSSNHGKINIKSFDSLSLEMSDIILASKVDADTEIAGRINREGSSILANPTCIFGKNEEFYIYYEVYNLAKDSSGLADFQQTITLKKKDEEPAAIGQVVNSVLKFIGIKNGDRKVGISSNYQSKKNYNQVSLQMDMSNYTPGDYTLMINLKDTNSRKEINNSISFIWR